MEPMNDRPLVSHISDTARWVSAYRAGESERPDALFHDPYARRLAGDVGQAIVDGIPGGQTTSWPMVARTVLMDEIILRVIEEGVDTVVNLAAGLDTRPWRLDLPNALRWIEVDLPDLMEWKQSQMADAIPRCQLTQLVADLADAGARRQALDQATVGARKALVITEGLLVYLESDQVTRLAHDLAAQSAVQLWLTDLASPGLLKFLERSWGPTLKAGNAPFKFAPPESTTFFEPLGWQELEWRSMFHESIRIGRHMRFARVFAFLNSLAPARKREEFFRFSGVTLLRRQAED
jgi:methyltransferase (TIGR00027 family)